MKPKCQHFGNCGGCSFQDVSYGEQIAVKQKALAEITGFKDVMVIPSPQIYNFRNKMEYSFEGENLGLHPAGRFDRVIDLKECPVFSPWVGGFLDEVRKFVKERNIPSYNRRSKSGLLRYLILRECKETGITKRNPSNAITKQNPSNAITKQNPSNAEKMVILVLNGSIFEYKEEWSKMVEGYFSGGVSVVIAKRHTSGDSAFTDDYEVIAGRSYIKMKAASVELDISPFSFFQPNSYQIENMYSLIAVSNNTRILDLYAGVGTISFYLAAPHREILGVEEDPICFKDALHNMKRLSPAGSIKFVKSKVKNFLMLQNSATIKKDPSNTEKYDYIIIDPPRGGISYKIWQRLDNLVLKKIFYISCSLKNLKKDIDFIKENTRWKISKVTGIDQFVHTPHLESVVEIDV